MPSTDYKEKSYDFLLGNKEKAQCSAVALAALVIVLKNNITFSFVIPLLHKIII